MKKTILGLTLLLALSTVGFAQQASSFNITERMIADAQKAWCGALVRIGESKTKGEDYQKVASDVIDAAYYYQAGPVLFKPTLTTGEQTFRMDKEGALAYFVGGNEKYKNDNGFALKGWTRCESKPRGFILNGDLALSMGNVYLWNAKGEETVVDKTWGYKMDENGHLKIVLHHSSLPYKP
ncbi:MAG: phosphoribosyl-AMP cyclohydrolase [Acidobacteria bacterium]|nr:phosphoribosyl-AMP cyclohydrolase [Acidobacteriota bacterium]